MQMKLNHGIIIDYIDKWNNILPFSILFQGTEMSYKQKLWLRKLEASGEKIHLVVKELGH